MTPTQTKRCDKCGHRETQDKRFWEMAKTFYHRGPGVECGGVFVSEVSELARRVS